MKFFILLISLVVVPHGDLEDSLATRDRMIAAEPARLELRLRRGELLRVHGAPLAALADFDQVLMRAPDFANARFFKALAFRDLKRLGSARRELDRHLRSRPDHAEGLRLSAQLADAMADRARALADWRALFSLSAPVSPDDALAFAAAARLATVAADEATALARQEEAALAALELALARLGPALPLELEAARCEARLGRRAACERRFDRMMARAARKDWFIRSRQAILAEANEKMGETR